MRRIWSGHRVDTEGSPFLRKTRVLGSTAWAALLIGINSCWEHPGSEQLKAPSWDLSEPSLVLGTRHDGPSAFSPIRDIAVGPRSELHVLLPQEQQVRVFSEDGAFLGSIGGQGDGPGEFRRPGRIGFMADTLWVIDESAGRISYFHDGVFLRVEPLPDLAGLHPERLAQPVGVLSGSRVLIATNVQTFEQPAVTTNAGLLLGQSDGILDTLAAVNVDHVAGFLVRRSAGGVRGMAVFSQPFSPQTRWTIASEGSGIIVVSPSLSGRDSSELSITRVSASGDTLFSSPHTYYPIPIPETVADSILTRYARGGFTRAEAEEAVYLPASYPPVSDVVAGADGAVWVAREELPGQRRKWQVFSDGGELLAEVEAPTGYEIRWVGEATTWGLVLDELDVPFLVKRSIIRE